MDDALHRGTDTDSFRLAVDDVADQARAFREVDQGHDVGY